MGYSSKRLVQSSSFFCALVFCLGLLADGREARAQRNQGHRVTNNSIVVETAEHWRNWQLPVHAVDVLPEGGVRPHYSRQRYNILDDQDTFTRPLTDFRRKKREHAILNIDSTFTLDVKGNVITDRKDNPLYTYFARPGISRVGLQSTSGAKHPRWRSEHLLGTRPQRSPRQLVDRGGLGPGRGRR